MSIHSWSDNDKRYGPFVLSKNTKDNNPLTLVLESKDDEDEENKSRIRISMFGYTLLIIIPPIIKPTKLPFISRNNAFNPVMCEHTTMYGFTYLKEDYFIIFYHGASTHDSDTDKTIAYFIPWLSYRLHQTSFFDKDGLVEKIIYDYNFYKLSKRKSEFREEKYSDDGPRHKPEFEIEDINGNKAIVKTTITERVRKRGTGYFTFVSYITKPLIQRQIWLDFDKLVCTKDHPNKGYSGTGYNLLPGELHEIGLRKFCLVNGMKFIRKI